jgi:hypothetical protein
VVVYLALTEPARGDLEVSDLASSEVRLGALESSHNLTSLSLHALFGSAGRHSRSNRSSDGANHVALLLLLPGTWR